MNTSLVTAADLLRELCGKLEAKRSSWTYATTEALRAVAAPRDRDGGNWDVVIHIQPERSQISSDIFGCVLQIAGEDRLRGSIRTGGRIEIGPLEQERYSLAVFDVSTHLREALRAMTEAWRRWAAEVFGGLAGLETTLKLAASPLVIGDFSPGKEIWKWVSAEGLVSATCTHRDRSLTWRIQSPEVALKGTIIYVRMGASRLPVLLEAPTTDEASGKLTLGATDFDLLTQGVTFEAEVAG